MNSQINVMGKHAAFFCIIHRKQIYSITNSIWLSSKNEFLFRLVETNLSLFKVTKKQKEFYVHVCCLQFNIPLAVRPGTLAHGSLLFTQLHKGLWPVEPQALLSPNSLSNQLLIWVQKLIG